MFLVLVLRGSNAHRPCDRVKSIPGAFINGLISYFQVVWVCPSIANLLIKVAVLAAVVGKALNKYCHNGVKHYQVSLSYLKQIALYYFRLKSKDKSQEILSAVLKRLWRETYAQVLPILNNAYQLGNKIKKGKLWPLRQALERLRWRGAAFMQQSHSYLFEGTTSAAISSLHAYEVSFFNKRKINRPVQYGRQFQLGRIGGNFLFVARCNSTSMPDAPSLPAVINLHQHLYGKDTLQSVATDKGYYSLENEQLLIANQVKDIYLPKPERTLNAPPETTPWEVRKTLHNRRAGIEPLIGHAKHGGQLGRSRMKSDETTKSAGYAAILGFNLRQLARCLMGEVRPKTQESEPFLINNGQIDLSPAISV